MFDRSNLPLDIATVVFLLAALYWVIPAGWRIFLLIFASAGMLIAFDPVYAALIIAQVLLVYAASLALSREGGGARKLIFAAIATWLVGCLVISKIRTGPQWFSPTALALGLSYITFRLIHYVVLAYRRELARPSALELLNHVIFFPSLLAGPVMYYETYVAERGANPRLTGELVSKALFRILIGVIKKFALGDPLYVAFIHPILAQPFAHSRWLVALGVCADLLRLYLDFSGYSDIAIGTAGLFGYRMPENFSSPLLKPNIAEFWRSWHISLHDFIRDHFFFPVFAYRPSQAKIYAGLFCTMLLMTLWHALSLGFFLVGVFHGAAFVVWQGLQDFKRGNRRLAAAFATRTARVLGTALTFLFCAFTFQFGFRGYEATLALYSRLLK